MKTIIIAGQTRSGLTLTMQMLHAGGYPCCGTLPGFEPYDVGEIPFDKYQGHAIKVVDTQTQFPPTGNYHVIRLHRDYTQQAKSITKFLSVITRQSFGASERKKFEKSLPVEYKKIDQWANKQQSVLHVNFESLITNPAGTAYDIAAFVGDPAYIKLDIAKMVEVVIERSPDCYPSMLELELIKRHESRSI